MDLDSSNLLFLEINQVHDPNTQWEFETEVLNFLKEYEQDGIISMDLVSESLSYSNSVELFEYTYKKWKNEVKDTLANGNLKEAFLRKGDKYIKIFGILGLILSVAVFFVIFSNSWTLVYNSYLFTLFYILLRIRNKDVPLIIYGVMGLIIIATSLFRVFSGHLAAIEIVFLSTMLLGAVSIISILLPEKIAGQWTTYGREYFMPVA